MVFPAFGLVLGTSLRRRGRDGIWERRPEPPWSGRGNPHPLSLAGARGGEFLPGGGQKADGGGALEGKRLRSAPIRSEAPAGLGRWARVPPSLPEPRDAGPTGRLVPGAPPPREEDRAAPPRLPPPRALRAADSRRRAPAVLGHVLGRVEEELLGIRVGRHRGAVGEATVAERAGPRGGLARAGEEA